MTFSQTVTSDLNYSALCIPPASSSVFFTMGPGYHLLQEAFFDFPKRGQGLSSVPLHSIINHLFTCLMPPLNCDLSVDGEHIFICVFWKGKISDTGPTLIKYFETITYINEFNKYLLSTYYVPWIVCSLC